ncbi:hypothetical protein E2P81_ATG09155 [Venturia nashicola]|nr:hypothetical protein E2P81_ATG09155 [Venturia nashicola]
MYPTPVLSAHRPSDDAEYQISNGSIMRGARWRIQRGCVDGKTCLTAGYMARSMCGVRVFVDWYLGWRTPSKLVPLANHITVLLIAKTISQN